MKIGKTLTDSSLFSSKLNAIRVLNKLPGTRKDKDIDILSTLLRNVNYVKMMRSKLPNGRYRDFLQLLTFKLILKGQTIYKEGDQEDYTYILLHGKVELSKEKNLSVAALKTKFINNDEVFGEFSFTENGIPRQYTATTVEECYLAILDRKKFLWLMKHVKDALKKISSELSKNSLFRYGFRQHELFHLAFYTTEVEYKKFAFVYQIGDPSNHFLFLKSGEIDTYANLPAQAQISKQPKFKKKMNEPEREPVDRQIYYSTWNDLAIFGDEEFMLCFNDELEYCDFKLAKKRDSTAFVVSEGAQILMLDAPVLLDILQDHPFKIKEFKRQSQRKIIKKLESLKKIHKVNDPDFFLTNLLSIEEQQQYENNETYETLNTSIESVDRETPREIARIKTFKSNDQFRDTKLRMNDNALAERINFIDKQDQMLHKKTFIRKNFHAKKWSEPFLKPFFNKTYLKDADKNYTEALNPRVDQIIFANQQAKNTLHQILEGQIKTFEMKTNSKTEQSEVLLDLKSHSGIHTTRKHTLPDLLDRKVLSRKVINTRRVTEANANRSVIHIKQREKSYDYTTFRNFSQYITTARNLSPIDTINRTYITSDITTNLPTNLNPREPSIFNSKRSPRQSPTFQDRQSPTFQDLSLTLDHGTSRSPMKVVPDNSELEKEVTSRLYAPKLNLNSRLNRDERLKLMIKKMETKSYIEHDFTQKLRERKIFSNNGKVQKVNFL